MFFLALLDARVELTELKAATIPVLPISTTAVTALIPMVVGYILGRKVWHLDWILLSGALCGGMTSTPGLGVAIDATGTEDAGASYGATYPFAIIGMVIFAKLLGLSV